MRAGVVNGRTRAVIGALPGRTAPTLAYPITWDGEAGVETKVPELIENMLPQIGVALLSGQWGLFKTFTAIDLALSVMTMTPFAGRNALRQGGVLFIAAEGAKYIPGRLAENLVCDVVVEIEAAGPEVGLGERSARVDALAP